MRGLRAGIAGLLVAAVLGGCGSSDDARGLSAAQAAGLSRQLESARAAAAARDPAAAQAAIDAFRRSVARLRRAGAISDATAGSLRTGAARVLQRVRSDITAAPPAPATQTTPVPLPPGHAKKKHGKGHGHGNQNENGD